MARKKKDTSQASVAAKSIPVVEIKPGVTEYESSQGLRCSIEMVKELRRYCFQCDFRVMQTDEEKTLAIFSTYLNILKGLFIEDYSIELGKETILFKCLAQVIDMETCNKKLFEFKSLYNQHTAGYKPQCDFYLKITPIKLAA